MPIRKKKGASTGADAVLTGEVPETVDPGLASLLEDPVSVGNAPTGQPKVRPTPAFLLRHWPENWEIGLVDGEAAWLPEVTPHLLVRGAAGIRTPAPHEPEANAYSDAVLAARRLGWIYLSLSEAIPTELLPPGVPAGRYRRRIRGTHPITRVPTEAWVTAWETPIQGLPSRALSFELHRESWNAWRASLAASGKLPAPTEQAKARVLARLERHLRRAKNAPLSQEIKGERIALLQSRVDQASAAKVLS